MPSNKSLESNRRTLSIHKKLYTRDSGVFIGAGSSGNSLEANSVKTFPKYCTQGKFSDDGNDERNQFDSSHKFHLLKALDSFHSRSLFGNPLLNGNNTRGCIYPGAIFCGEQRSGRVGYSVNVRILEVDFEKSSLCGYLNIQGLTDDNPDLTTYFEAEILGNRHSFLTSKWCADYEIDEKHWTKFGEHFRGTGYEREFQMSYNREIDENYKMCEEVDFLSEPTIFMRWKEQFLVPNHHIQTIQGASFEGFYYICCDVFKGNITGFYYHQNSEWFQHLVLKHCDGREPTVSLDVRRPTDEVEASDARYWTHRRNQSVLNSSFSASDANDSGGGSEVNSNRNNAFGLKKLIRYEQAGKGVPSWEFR